MSKRTNDGILTLYFLFRIVFHAVVFHTGPAMNPSPLRGSSTPHLGRPAFPHEFYTECPHVWFSEESRKHADAYIPKTDGITGGGISVTPTYSFIQLQIGDRIWHWDVCLLCGWPKITQVAGEPHA